MNLRREPPALDHFVCVDNLFRFFHRSRIDDGHTADAPFIQHRPHHHVLARFHLLAECTPSVPASSGPQTAPASTSRPSPANTKSTASCSLEYSRPAETLRAFAPRPRPRAKALERTARF